MSSSDNPWVCDKRDESASSHCGASEPEHGSSSHCSSTMTPKPKGHRIAHFDEVCQAFSKVHMFVNDVAWLLLQFTSSLTREPRNYMG